MYKKISSTQNVLVKQIIKLQDKARERKKTQQFVFEGLRELKLAIDSGYTIDKLLFFSDLITASSLEDITKPQTELIEIDKNVYQKIAYRNTTEGIIAIANSKMHTLSELILSKNPLILVVESPEKPGNMGAILRTADAANVDAIIIANPKTDLYNPNSIRSSVGCVFTNQIGIGSTKEVINFLKSKKINIYTAALKDKASVYTEIDYTKPTVIVVGTEATGLSEDWFINTNKNIIIPMKGKIDSMNVSVATGVLVFEAVRQRND